MINLSEAVPLAEAVSALPVKPSRRTLGRWVNVGINGVTLEHARVGQRIVTTPAAVARFVQALSNTTVVCEA